MNLISVLGGYFGTLYAVFAILLLAIDQLFGVHRPEARIFEDDGIKSDEKIDFLFPLKEIKKSRRKIANLELICREKLIDVEHVIHNLQKCDVLCDLLGINQYEELLLLGSRKNQEGTKIKKKISARKKFKKLKKSWKKERDLLKSEMKWLMITHLKQPKTETLNFGENKAFYQGYKQQETANTDIKRNNN
jgi:hypothetical protein